MKGLSLFFLTIFIIILYLVDESSMWTFIGGVRGEITKVMYLVGDLKDTATSGGIFNKPKGFEVLISDCVFPINSNMTDDDRKLVLSTCNGKRGIVCVFYPYYKYKYRSCKDIIYEPESQYYFSAEAPAILKINVNNQDMSLTVSKIG